MSNWNCQIGLESDFAAVQVAGKLSSRNDVTVSTLARRTVIDIGY